MQIYYGLKESISQARKVFRLFRFFDEIKGLVKILKTDKPIAFKILSVFTYFCSIMYYIADNTLWAINIVVKSGGLDRTIAKNWKYRKNFLSLCRVIAYSVILIYSVILQKKDLKDKIFTLKKYEEKEKNIKPES
jgi:hypothetical protein